MKTTIVALVRCDIDSSLSTFCFLSTSNCNYAFIKTINHDKHANTAIQLKNA